MEETAAGKIIMDRLNKLRGKYERDIKKLRKQLADATVHRDRVEAIRIKYEEKLQEQEKAAEQAKSFKKQI